jgi:hypothetical protein
MCNWQKGVFSVLRLHENVAEKEVMENRHSVTMRAEAIPFVSAFYISLLRAIKGKPDIQNTIER